MGEMWCNSPDGFRRAGCSRSRGSGAARLGAVARTLRATLLLAFVAAANSAGHHETAADWARRGAPSRPGHPPRSRAEPAPESARRVASRPLVASRHLGAAPSVASGLGELDVTRLHRRAREIEEAAYAAPSPISGAAVDDDDALAMLEAVDADVRALDEDFPELARFSDDAAVEALELESAAAAAAFQEAQENQMLGGRSEELAAEDAYAEVRRSIEEEGRDDLQKDASAGKKSGASRRTKDASSSGKHRKSHKNRGKKRDGGPERSKDAFELDAAAFELETSSTSSTFSSSSSFLDSALATAASDSPDSASSASDLILQLTTKAPPPPPEGSESASSGFPSFVPGATVDASDAEKALDGWTLAWSDEFDGDHLDSTKWTARDDRSSSSTRGTPGTTHPDRTPGLPPEDAEEQTYDPRECRVRGGALAIRTRKKPGEYFFVPGARRTDPTRESPFASCWVDSREAFSQTYGRIEIRAKFPEHQCPGVSPRHRLFPDPATSVPRDACWPTGGQVDVASAYGRGRGGPGARAGTVEAGYHFAPQGECGVDGEAKAQYPPQSGGTGSDDNPLTDNLNNLRGDFHSEFHVFAVEWDKRSLAYFVDGVETLRLSQFHVPIIPRWPFYVALSTAVSAFGMPDALECDYDSYHYVDYVRVYRRETRGVDGKVWTFLGSSVAGLAVALALVACCAARNALDEDEGATDDYGGEYYHYSGRRGGGEFRSHPRGGGDEYEYEYGGGDAREPPRVRSVSRDFGVARDGATPLLEEDSEDGVDRSGGALFVRTRGGYYSASARGGFAGAEAEAIERSRRFDRVDRAPRRETLRLFDEAPGFSGGGGGRGGPRGDAALKRRWAPAAGRETAPLIGGVSLRLPEADGGRGGRGAERGSERAYDRV